MCDLYFIFVNDEMNENMFCLFRLKSLCLLYSLGHTHEHVFCVTHFIHNLHKWNILHVQPNKELTTIVYQAAQYFFLIL